MTDYLYSISLATQTKGFLQSLGFGFIMGIFYDLFRIIRICISRGKVAVIISDICYCIFLCFASYLFFLTVNEGEIRGFILMGEVAGFFIYYFSLGLAIFSISKKIVDAVKDTLQKLLRIFLLPFSAIGKLMKKNVKKWQKKNEKIKNKSKFLLKVNKHLLYNLNVKVGKSARHKKHK